MRGVGDERALAWWSRKKRKGLLKSYVKSDQWNRFLDSDFTGAKIDRGSLKMLPNPTRDIPAALENFELAMKVTPLCMS
jgi:hypothetical protein